MRDPDVRGAIQTLNDEFENLEETIREKEAEIEELEDDKKELNIRIEELEQRVKDLEEALAESYLTDEADDGRVTEESNDRVQGGRSSDVPDTADN